MTGLIEDTPFVAIDLDIVDWNIEKMQLQANHLGLDLRPHIKTHKLPLLAQRQLAAGATGIACQKLGEAWVFASSGIGPILITYPLLGEAKWEAAARLANEFPVSFCADSELVVDGLSRHLNPEGNVAVLVDCDTGKWRTGVPEPADALRLAEIIESKPGLTFGGLMTHPAPDHAVKWFNEAFSLFTNSGMDVPAISVGGTLGAYDVKSIYEIATELRVGTYIYGDRACINSGSNSQQECALRVHSTVVSTPSKTRAIIDAGSKVLSSDLAEGIDDQKYGLIVGRPDATLSSLSEEHGHIDIANDQEQLELGQTVEIIPNHACVVSNLTDRVQLHRSGVAIMDIPVLARGKSR